MDPNITLRAGTCTNPECQAEGLVVHCEGDGAPPDACISCYTAMLTAVVYAAGANDALRFASILGGQAPQAEPEPATSGQAPAGYGAYL